MHVTAVPWWPDTAHEREELLALVDSHPDEGPLLTQPSLIEHDLVNAPFALKVNEEQDVPLQIRIPPEDPRFFLKQAVVVARCTDVERHGAYEQRLGLRLVALARAGNKDTGTTAYKTVWKRLTDADVEQISRDVLTTRPRKSKTTP